jgi:hypothetical protein
MSNIEKGSRRRFVKRLGESVAAIPPVVIGGICASHAFKQGQLIEGISLGILSGLLAVNGINERKKAGRPAYTVAVQDGGMVSDLRIVETLSEKSRRFREELGMPEGTRIIKGYLCPSPGDHPYYQSLDGNNRIEDPYHLIESIQIPTVVHDVHGIIDNASRSSEDVEYLRRVQSLLYAMPNIEQIFEDNDSKRLLRDLNKIVADYETTWNESHEEN